MDKYLLDSVKAKIVLFWISLDVAGLACTATSACQVGHVNNHIQQVFNSRPVEPSRRTILSPTEANQANKEYTVLPPHISNYYYFCKFKIQGQLWTCTMMK